MLSHVNWKIVANVLRDRSALYSGSSRPQTCRHALISQYTWVFAASMWKPQIQRKLIKHLKITSCQGKPSTTGKVDSLMLLWLICFFLMFLYTGLFSYLLLCLYLRNYLHSIRSMWRSLRIAFSCLLFIAPGESYCYSVKIWSDFLVIKTFFFFRFSSILIFMWISVQH